MFIDPYDYVRHEHAARRSWKSQEQKALVIGELIERSEEYQESLTKIQEEANKVRSEAANSRRGIGGRLESKPVVPQSVARLVDSAESKKTIKPNRTAGIKAEILEVNRGAIERAAAIKNKSPELADKVAAGEMTASAALREIKRRETAAALEDISARRAKELSGVYDVIVIAPPWPMKKIERDVRPNQLPSQARGEHC
jgi:hypothetical protein